MYLIRERFFRLGVATPIVRPDALTDVLGGSGVESRYLTANDGVRLLRLTSDISFPPSSPPSET